jgi:hypothetical protein
VLQRKLEDEATTAIPGKTFFKHRSAAEDFRKVFCSETPREGVSWAGYTERLPSGFRFSIFLNWILF